MTDTTPPPDSPPLWRLMADAYDRSSVPAHLIDAADPETGDCLTDRYGYAAEIRARLLAEAKRAEQTND